ncbi:MAG: SURF1 family protein, partial [Hyphomicrobiaceae bacterium]
MKSELARAGAGRLWLPTLITLLGLAVLVALGTWQLQRKQWKEGLQKLIDERARAEPLEFAKVRAEPRYGNNLEYLRIRVRGRFLNERERHVFTSVNGQAGFLVYTPLMTSDRWLVLVNRGFVPQALKDADKRKDGQPPGEVELVGLARTPGKRAWFTPAHDDVRNIFFWADYAAMLRGIPEMERGGVVAAPFLLDAELKPPNPGGWPRGGATLLSLPNRHLEYALTWYGLALTLLAVYAIYMVNA